MFPHQSPVKKQLLLSRSLRIITNTIFKACKIAKKGEERCRGRRKKHSYRMMIKREDAEEFGEEGD
ncbi:hypothetical protein KY285_030193 [Solanum tuberosum]|nr:hypothetical protein KY289_030331 [Solanum tuberosum]KAH0655311.1 hypothetical protein KY285_030193 [Solanum tuberosum]